MLRRTFLSGLGLLGGALFPLSCKKNPANGDKPRVAVSIFPLYDVARRIGGDKLDVVLVLPPGRTEHTYDPTPKEMAKLAGSKLAVSVGLHLDTWLDKIVKGAAGTGVAALEIGPRINPLPMGKEAVGEGDDHDDHDHHDHDHEHGAMDPHFWLDPVRMQTAVDVIAESFRKLHEPAKDDIAKNADALKKALGALHDKTEARAKAWTKRSIVTFHGSFGYYAKRYNLDVAAVIEPFPGKEPTPKYLTEVLAAIGKAKPAALFSEPQLDNRPAKVVADQAKLPLYELDPIGGAGAIDTYEKLIDVNTDALERALK